MTMITTTMMMTMVIITLTIMSRDTTTRTCRKHSL